MVYLQDSVKLRSLGVRSGSLLLALLFLTGGAERAFGLTRCPHHNRQPGHALPHAAHHAAAPADIGAPDGETPEQDESCTCVSACQQSPTAATSPIAGAVFAASVCVPAAAPQPADAPRPRLQPHQLPFAIPPPSSVLLTTLVR
jgi:hypothetical protein